uniref:DUF4367 domain-containing protein n=1 Tax=Heterorhabditis bacteriophora TaxID=37862 RepID=A0A1I7XI96_HETBA
MAMKSTLYGIGCILIIIYYRGLNWFGVCRRKRGRCNGYKCKVGATWVQAQSQCLLTQAQHWRNVNAKSVSIDASAKSVSIDVSAKSVSIDASAKSVSIDASAKSVSIDASAKSVSIDVSAESVSIDASAKSVSIDASAKSVSIDASAKSVSIDVSAKSVSIDASAKSVSIDASAKSVSIDASAKSVQHGCKRKVGATWVQAQSQCLAIEGINFGDMPSAISSTRLHKNGIFDMDDQAFLRACAVIGGVVIVVAIYCIVKCYSNIIHFYKNAIKFHIFLNYEKLKAQLSLNQLLNWCKKITVLFPRNTTREGAEELDKTDKWVPHELNGYQKIRRYEICSALLLRKKINPFLDRIETCDENGFYTTTDGLHQEKGMATVGWSASGVIHYNFLCPGETTTAEKYCHEIDKMLQELQLYVQHWSIEKANPPP